VEEHTIPLVRKTLQWIIYAERKLTLKELVEIVSLEDDDDALDSEAYPDPEDLLRSCGSLVREGHGCLELAHFTVQEFLAAIDPDDKQLNMFRVSAGTRLTLAKACVSYLCLSTFDEPPMVLFQRDKSDYPFLTYASEFFLEYTLPHQYDDDFIEQIHRLFHPEKSYNFTLFMLERLRLHASYLHEHEMVSVCSPTFSPLHGAAMLHMHEICRWLVDQKCDVNQVSHVGVPLECAIYGTAHVLDSTQVSSRHLGEKAAQATISVLLNAGADCDIELVWGNSLSSAVADYMPWDPTSPFVLMLQHGMPLQADAIPILSRCSDEDQQRLFHSIDILEGKGKISISPEVRIHLLNFAHKKKLTTSVSIPSKDRMTDKTFFEAIRHAVRFDQVSAFEKLVGDSTSSVDLACSEEGGTFSYAAKNHSVQILHKLLDMGCDLTISGELGKLILHEVIRLGIDEERLLCRLISSKAAKVLDKEGRSIWHEAASEGRFRVLEILFDQPGPHKSLLHQPCKNGITPILEAILKQHGECADLLLSKTCADKTITLDEHTLHHAVAMGLHSFLEKLRDCGADLCAASEQNRTALYYLTSFTKSHTIDLLLGCGLDPCHLDACGKPPLAAFLALDEPRNHRMLNLVKGPQKHVLEKTVIEALASADSVANRDENGHTAWFYFCTRMIPFILGSDMATKQSYLADILSILLRYEACQVYEDAAGASGVSLLVKMSLDSVHKSANSSDLRSTKSWDTSSDSSRNTSSDSEDGHDTRTAIAAITGISLDAMCTAVTTRDISNDPQLIRLLMWSIEVSERSLIERLLELGVDVHSASDHYHGMTPLDQSITLDAEPDIFDLLLQRADNSRLITVDEQGDLTHFCLCYPNPDMRTKNRLTKLEALLKAGVNPDARGPSSLTMAHTAAGSGCLKTLQLLVRFNANLSLANRYGWTVVQYAVADGDLDLLKFVHKHLPDTKHWEARFPWKGSSSRPGNLVSGPLPVEVYFSCNILHLATFGYKSTNILQFLRETGCFDDVDAKTHEGATPLHFAACIKSPATRWLISNGANVDMPLSAKKRTALHYALRLGHLKNALSLIEAGAKFVADSDGISPEMGVHPEIRSQLMAALPHCGVSIPPSVLENLGSDYKLQRLGGLYRAIKEGDYEACLSIAQSGKPLTSSMMKCGTCTPLIVALAWGQLDIAKVFLQHGASTDGFPCAQTRRMGPLLHSALNIAISQPKLNGILEKLLDLTLKHEAHWSQGSDVWQPLHLAAACNAGGLKVILNHVNKHRDLIT
jgi:ankyrin repeat protein